MWSYVQSRHMYNPRGKCHVWYFNFSLSSFFIGSVLAFEVSSFTQMIFFILSADSESKSISFEDPKQNAFVITIKGADKSNHISTYGSM